MEREIAKCPRVRDVFIRGRAKWGWFSSGLRPGPLWGRAGCASGAFVGPEPRVATTCASLGGLLSVIRLRTNVSYTQREVATHAGGRCRGNGQWCPHTAGARSHPRCSGPVPESAVSSPPLLLDDFERLAFTPHRAGTPKVPDYSGGGGGTSTGAIAYGFPPTTRACGCAGPCRRPSTPSTLPAQPHDTLLTFMFRMAQRAHPRLCAT